MATYTRTGNGIPASEQHRQEFAKALRAALAQAKLENAELAIRKANNVKLEKPLSQNELAARCTTIINGGLGFSKYAISRWLNGERMPNLTNISILCKALKIEVKDLFPLINPKDKMAVLTSRQVEKLPAKVKKKTGIGYPRFSKDGVGRVRKLKGK